jgi:hypothetical protein
MQLLFASSILRIPESIKKKASNIREPPLTHIYSLWRYGDIVSIVDVSMSYLLKTKELNASDN